MSNKSILCIDDEPIRYNALAFQAEQKDIQILLAQTIAQAKFYLDRPHQIIGICLDHDMPEANGLHYAEHIIENPTIPIVITSLNTDGARRIGYILDNKGTKWYHANIGVTTWAWNAITFFLNNQL